MNATIDYNKLQKDNAEYADLYDYAIREYEELAPDATFEDIKQLVDKLAGKHIGDVIKLKIPNFIKIKMGNRFIKAGRKYTYHANPNRRSVKAIKTNYLHILVLDNHNHNLAVAHWKEKKDGNFTQV